MVGGNAVIFHSRPRFTKGLDVWVQPGAENARRLMHAFSIFGIPLINVSEEDFAVEGTQYVIGMPPTSIDFLTTLPDLAFEDCWKNRGVDTVAGTEIPYLGKGDLIASKRRADRPEDRIDLRNLEMLDGE